MTGNQSRRPCLLCELEKNWSTPGRDVSRALTFAQGALMATERVSIIVGHAKGDIDDVEKSFLAGACDSHLAVWDDVASHRDMAAAIRDEREKGTPS